MVDGLDYSSVSRSADCNDGDIQVMADRGDGLAVNEVEQAAVAVPAHYDQVHAFFLGDLDQFCGCVAVAQHGVDGRHAFSAEFGSQSLDKGFQVYFVFAAFGVAGLNAVPGAAHAVDDVHQEQFGAMAFSQRHGLGKHRGVGRLGLQSHADAFEAALHFRGLGGHFFGRNFGLFHHRLFAAECHPRQKREQAE